jgi:hypothetical protein
MLRACDLSRLVFTKLQHLFCTPCADGCFFFFSFLFFQILLQLLQGLDWSELRSAFCDLSQGDLLLIYICNFHVLSNLLLIYTCKLYWNLNTMFVCQVIFLLIYICNFHVLNHLLLIYMCKLHWNFNMMFVALHEHCPKVVPCPAVPIRCTQWRNQYSAWKYQLGEGKLLLIYMCNFHVLNHLLLIYIYKPHWNLHLGEVKAIRKA